MENNKIYLELINLICLSGGNISIMKNEQKRKYVSKRKINKLLDIQLKYLLKIDTIIKQNYKR